ncbi:serine/threonine-protein kinase [Nannocystis sp. SCPEA4]|uniref:serine/threonine-protein kinase n=1 Tax=Nannocystis sp. SCPEA4 TaxID=2996787 RepID=UPI0022703C30|nr:protein kinase [Nannocystis sp. SCPEA4]
MSRDDNTQLSLEEAMSFRSGDDLTSDGKSAPSQPREPDPGESAQFVSFANDKRFNIVRRVGAGGMGVVYEAIDRERAHPVALKTLLNVSPGALYRFKREFRALADVAHPNVIQLHELFFEGEQIFFTMEYIDGLEFVEYVRGAADESEEQDPAALAAEREQGWERLRAALRQLAAGLGALHAAGKLHRDIKPSNVLITREGRLVILDFGLVSDSITETVRSTEAGGVVGTPAYMSPEQAGGQPASTASDWYAVGVMVFQALTGELPFKGKGLKVMIAKQDRDAPVPSSIVSGLPKDLEELCLALLSRDPKARPSSAEVLQRVGSGPTGIRPRAAVGQERDLFVGREAQLRALQDAAAATQKGRAALVQVYGRSGMGKSALVREFLARLQRGPAVVLAGRCYERESVSFKALDSLIDALAKHLLRLPEAKVAELMPRDVHALARVFPVLQRVKAVTQAPRRSVDIPDPRELRRRAFAALKELLARLADRAPLVLHIDDLQWGDRDSAALLADLLRPPDAPALLLIASYRTEAHSGAVLKTLREAARGELDLRELQIGPLSEADAEDLAQSLLPANLRARARQVAREAQGNPLFVSELVRHLLATGERPGERGEVTLDRVLLARIDGLPEPARRLLEIAAVAGGPVDLRLAGAAAGLPETHAALATLRSEHLVLTRSGDSEVIETYHDRVRELVLAALAPDDLKARHRDLAFAMEHHGERDSDTLALHYREAGEWERAGDYAQMAADQAAAALAFDRAARLYRLALEFKPHSDKGRAELSVRLADALANAGRGVKAARLYLEAAASEPPARALELRRRAGEQFIRAGQLPEGMATMRQVLAAAGMSLPATSRALHTSLTWERARWRLRGLGLRERDPRTTDPDDLVRLAVCRTLSSSLAAHDLPLTALFQARYLNLSYKTGNIFHAACALAAEVAFVSSGGENDRARTEKLASAAQALLQRTPEALPRGLLALSRGVAAFHFGRWRESIVLLEQSEQILRSECTGTNYEIVSGQSYRLIAHFLLGDLRVVGQRLATFIAEARDRDDSWSDALLRGGPQVAYWLAEDDLLRARAEIGYVQQRLPEESLGPPRLWTFVGSLLVDFYGDDPAAPWGRVEREFADLETSFLFHSQWAHVVLGFLRAQAALLRLISDHGDSERAGLVRLVEHEASRLALETAPWARPLGELVGAGLAATLGHKDRALAGLRAAEPGLRAADMALYAAAARRRLGELTGGDKGAEMIAAADLALGEQGVRRPDRMTRALLPGFPSR